MKSPQERHRLRSPANPPITSFCQFQQPLLMNGSAPDRGGSGLDLSRAMRSRQPRQRAVQRLLPPAIGHYRCRPNAPTNAGCHAQCRDAPHRLFWGLECMIIDERHVLQSIDGRAQLPPSDVSSSPWRLATCFDSKADVSNAVPNKDDVDDGVGNVRHNRIVRSGHCVPASSLRRRRIGTVRVREAAPKGSS